MVITIQDHHIYIHVKGQKKCDYLIYCQNKPQTCFVELKGANISIKNNYNPYDQIMDTIKYLQSKDELKELVDKKGGKHAFIVSPSRQNIPKGSNTKERQLWKKLILIGNEKGKQISDIVHYVKVTPSDKYSNHNQIICSAKSPIEIPFSN